MKDSVKLEVIVHEAFVQGWISHWAQQRKAEDVRVTASAMLHELPAAEAAYEQWLVGRTKPTATVERARLDCGHYVDEHPATRNMLEGAAERDGRICKLGWPL